MNYPTLDYLPDLTPAEMASANPLTLTKVTDPKLADYENSALFASASYYASLAEIFSFQGTAGANYSILSSSYFDPFVLRVFDAQGNVIAVDDGQLDYGYDHVFFFAPYTGTYYVNASWNQGAASGHQTVALGIFEDLDTVPKPNFITGTSGKDRIRGTADNDVVDGGEDVDTFLLGGRRENYSVTVDHGKITVTDLNGLSGSDTLQNFERIQFFDGILSFDTTGLPPQAYRLYQAAFNRTPDAGGLGYWLTKMGEGTSLHSVAEAFTSSPEFIQMYGANPSNSDVLTKVYQNVLHRPPDQAGFSYWLDLLDHKSISTVDMLVAFSESAENQAQVVGSLQAGYFIAT